MGIYKASAVRVANRFLSPPKQWKEDAQALAAHQRAARAAFREQVGNIEPLARKVMEGTPQDKWSRVLGKGLKSHSEVLEFLTTYMGSDADHPKARVWRTSARNLLRDVSLGTVGINKALKKLDLASGRGFQALEMSKSQAPLRQILPEELRAFLPVNIVVDVDDEGNIARVTDRFKNANFTLGEKIKRMKQILQEYNQIVGKVKKDLKSSDEMIKLSALVTAILMETGIRPGSPGTSTIMTVEGEKMPVETFGATTLGPGHIRFVRNAFVNLEFLGKAGTVNTATLADIQIIRVLQDYVKKALASGSKYVFVTESGDKFTYAHLQKYFRSRFKGLSPSDFRKLKATTAVLESLREEQGALLNRIRAFAGEETDNLRGRVVEEVVETLTRTLDKAQAALSHSDSKVTQNSYINPEVLLRFLSQGRIENTLHAAILGGKTQLAFDPMTFVEMALQKEASGKDTTLQDLIDALEEELA